MQDPISLIEEHDKWRLPFLLPIKYGRMAASAFGFLRGSAAVMAADLSSTPVTGIQTMLSGDAHLANFGMYASPERRLIFDLNDFDESYPGPWEWDLKRLAASAVVVGRDSGFKAADNRKLAKQVAKKYRQAMTKFANMPILDVWYSHVEAKELLEAFRNSKKDQKILKKAVKKARSRTEEQSLEKFTVVVDGQRQFVDDPPLTSRLTNLLEGEEVAEKVQIKRDDLEKDWQQYVGSVEMGRRALLSRYHIVDVALRVVGVGSVGTFCFMSLLEANSIDDAIVLQQKEAGASVLEPYLPKQEFANHADRVVTGQRLMQSESDVFLGWSHGFATTSRDYYWRQLKDMKGSVEASQLDVKGLLDYVASCSYCLARAHARSGDAVSISGYLDNAEPFDEAIADFGVSYAEQTECDYRLFLKGIKAGRIIAQENT